jgi:hypothetical protein
VVSFRTRTWRGRENHDELKEPQPLQPLGYGTAGVCRCPIAIDSALLTAGAVDLSPNLHPV